MDATVLILKELQEIKEQLQNISDALKPKETITYYYEEGDKSTNHIIPPTTIILQTSYHIA